MNYAKSNPDMVKGAGKYVGQMAYDNREAVGNYAYENKEYIA